MSEAPPSAVVVLEVEVAEQGLEQVVHQPSLIVSCLEIVPFKL